MPQSTEKSDAGKVPEHVAIIMDGNGRWARARGLPRVAGHRAGTENLREIIESATEFGIKYLTLYAFSTENWGRPPDEIEGLIHILEDVIDRELMKLHKEGVRLLHIGNLECLRPRLRQKVQNAIELTRNNARLTVVLAFNYGGRDDILQAVRRIVSEGFRPEEISEDLINRYLYTAGIPDPDLMIRTAGEMRLSNFLIWQISYSELYVTPVFWPDFNKEELRKALQAYATRDRRYGKLKDCDNTAQIPHAG